MFVYVCVRSNRYTAPPHHSTCARTHMHTQTQTHTQTASPTLLLWGEEWERLDLTRTNEGITKVQISSNPQLCRTLNNPWWKFIDLLMYLCSYSILEFNVSSYACIDIHSIIGKPVSHYNIHNSTIWSVYMHVDEWLDPCYVILTNFYKTIGLCYRGPLSRHLQQNLD